MAKLTITQISIENLGPFRERQTLDLYGKSSRPVTLIKALNGSGKTTLLTALQIGLYGYKAINPGRRSEYEQLITSLQRKDAKGNAVIEVSVAIEQGAHSQTLTIRREWMPRGANLQEQFSVLSQGILDIEFTETWDEFINGILCRPNWFSYSYSTAKKSKRWPTRIVCRIYCAEPPRCSWV